MRYKYKAFESSGITVKARDGRRNTKYHSKRIERRTTDKMVVIASLQYFKNSPSLSTKHPGS